MTTVHIVGDPAEGGEVAANEFAVQLSMNPESVIGVATGSTPRTTWHALSRRQLDLSLVRAFALDEYLDLREGHPESYRAVVDREVVAPLGLTLALVRTPGDDGKDDGAPARYERAIEAAGGIDIQLLGIGRNGHIAFNEPGASLASRTRIAQLSEQTRQDNARFFDSIEEVPTRCITQGVGTILSARRILLIAYGSQKADAVAAALEGPVTSSLPGSALQLHPDVTVILDDDAAAKLRLSRRSERSLPMPGTAA